MKEEKRKKIEACREEIKGIVSKYIDREAKSNTGQLKFLNGLLTGNLAVSIGIKLRRDALFLKYLRENILEDREEVLAFLDPEKNREAFLNSPYCYGKEAYEGLPLSFEMPSYLLVTKAQKVMERECIRYIRLPDKAENEKKAAYVEWLFATALYEIFLVEFGRGLPALPSRKNIEEKPIKERYPDIFRETDLKKRKQQILELLEQFQEECSRFRSQGLFLLCLISLRMHTKNLCAMLRIIALIEFVKVNQKTDRFELRERDRDRAAQMNAMLWRDREEQWKNSYLFTTIQRNHNLDVLVRQFKTMYQSNQIIPQLSKESCLGEFTQELCSVEEAMFVYLEVIKKRRDSRDPEKLETELWNVSLPFGEPVMSAMGEIYELREHSAFAKGT